MSGEDEPRDQDVGEQGGRPTQGDQPQHDEQPPDRGQPPQGGEQPQRGQPAQGGQAPQAGQTYQPPVDQGPGMVDKLQRPHIKENLIGTVAIYALLGFGLFIALLIIPGLGDGESALASTTVGNGMLGFGFGVGLLLAVLRGRDAATLDAEQNVKLVSSFIGNGGGYFVLGLLAVFGASSSSDDLGLSSSGIGGQGGFEVGVGDFFVPLILLAILVGIIGVATVFLEDYL